jgi:DNA-directed RNA polymerase specialized sigma24 family protein
MAEHDRTNRNAKTLSARNPHACRATREQDIATFYARHATALRHAVARRPHAPEHTIEDACQTAWAILLRRADITLDHHGIAWLTKVATRDAWRIATRNHEIPAGAFATGDTEPGTLSEPAGPGTDPAEHVVAREHHDQRAADVARLKPRERQALYLQALGYSYHEIAQLSGGWTVMVVQTPSIPRR